MRGGWSDGKGRKVASPALADTPVRTTKVVLMAGHPDHGPGHGGYRHRNVKALCQSTARPAGASTTHPAPPAPAAGTG